MLRLQMPLAAQYSAAPAHELEDRIRAAKVRRADPLPEDLDDIGGRGSLVTATTGAADPADLAVADERRRLVLAALDQLPPDQRAALILVDMEGYPVAEVAEMLDCAVGTVKSRCSRGRTRLATLLGVHVLVAVGALFGSSVLDVVDVPFDSLGAQLIFTLGVSLILFYGGLSLSLPILRGVWMSLLMLGLAAPKSAA